MTAMLPHEIAVPAKPAGDLKLQGAPVAAANVSFIVGLTFEFATDGQAGDHCFWIA